MNIWSEWWYAVTAIAGGLLLAGTCVAAAVFLFQLAANWR